MSHYLPVEEIKKNLRTAVEEFESALQELQEKEDQLEAELGEVLEIQRIDDTKKKLSV